MNSADIPPEKAAAERTTYWRLLFISAIALAGISGCSGSYDSATGDRAKTAESAYVRGDYPGALGGWQGRAEKGDPEAQYGLGYMYRNGQGVPQDYKEAAKWYGKAAAQGLAKAQVKLALMYAKGHGMPQNYVQAHKWFNLAAAQGYKDAAQARDKVAKSMRPAEIDEAISLAQQWMPKK